MSLQSKSLEIAGTRVGGGVKKSVPQVSVVIPAYNVTEYIAEALDSVLAQTFTDSEIILVNDGTPDTPEFEHVIARYLKHVIYVKQENLGSALARNRGIVEARGKLLAFLDADDIWLPEFLESQIEALRQNGFGMIYADALLFGESKLAGKTFMETAPSDGTVTLSSLLTNRCNIITSGTVVCKEFVVQAGLFDPKLRTGQDFDLWTRIAYNNVKIGYQRRVLLKYRIRRDGLSGSQVERMQRALKLMACVKQKLALTPADALIVEEQIVKFNALQQLEKGKAYLLQRDFRQALLCFRESNRKRQNFKLNLVILLCRLCPRLFLSVFKMLRSADLSLIHSRPVDKI